MMIETLKLYILISVMDDNDLHSRTQLYKKKKQKQKNVGVHFLANLNIYSDEIQYVATIC